MVLVTRETWRKGKRDLVMCDLKAMFTGERTNRLRVFLLPEGLTFHLLAQVGAPAVPHVLHGQQVPVGVVEEQQRDAGHHQLIHDAQACAHLGLFSRLKHGGRLLI